MNRAAQFLRDCGTFYLATEEGDQPRVRPFGAVVEYEGKTYICTNNTKKCFRQMAANPKVELCAAKGNEWIRIAGEAVADPRPEARRYMLEQVPMLKDMYRVDDGIFEVLYLRDATATIESMAGASETFKL